MVDRPVPMPGTPARPRLLAPVAAGVVLVLVLLAVAVDLYTDYLWFGDVGKTQVFTTVLGTRVLLFAVFGLLMALVVGANIAIAYRTRPPFRPMSLEQQNLERYRVAVEPLLVPVLLGVSGVFGLFAGLSASARWETWLLWLNRTPFGVADFQFGKDISYFTFTYPFQRFLLGFVFSALVLATIAAGVTHYLFGGVRLQTPGEKVSAAARAHLSVLVGLFVLAKAYAYWLDRYGLAFSQRGVVTGPSYTDVNAVLPTKTALVAIAAICALLFFANIVVRNFALPVGALGLLVASAVLVGGIYPAAVQQFRVKPNEVRSEAMFIARNIEATRAAYGMVFDKTALDTEADPENAELERPEPTVEVRQYPATAELDDPQVRTAIRNDEGTIPNTRLLDPNVLNPTFRQLQQIRGYYGFAESLDIDRYDLGDGLKDYVVGVRELNLAGLQDQQRTWINEHLTYTHGNGIVLAPASEFNKANGEPRFVVRDIPVQGPLEVDQPRIYFGELSPTYSVVNTQQGEIDGPVRPGDDGEGADRADFNYDGDGGVLLSNLFRKALYAVKFRERNLLLSGAITDESRIQYIREPRERVEKVAPFLTLDGDPYPAVVDGRILWIVDGYTTSDAYPYSERTVLGEAAADALSGVSNQTLLPPDEVNYIRNSVKATVDAYTGDVSLYAWDEEDPVLSSWRKAFPGLVEDRDEMSDELLAHVRYPEDLFKVQRDLLQGYHVGDATGFYSREDFWNIPEDQSAETTADGQTTSPTGVQPPYYQLLQPPGTDEPRFALTTPFVARSRPNLAAYVTVSSDVEDGEYGRLRILQLPRDTAIPGPGTVAGNFESNPTVAESLSLLRRGGSRVTLGNLLTLPVGGTLLYVQPVYVQAAGGESYPLLRQVLVGVGDQVAYSPTFEEALDQLFGAGTGRPTPTTPTRPTQPADPGTPTPTASPSPTAPASLEAAIAEASAAFAEGEEALRRGDFAAYGRAQERLRAALEAAAAASGRTGGGGSAPASPTPSPSG